MSEIHLLSCFMEAASRREEAKGPTLDVHRSASHRAGTEHCVAERDLRVPRFEAVAFALPDDLERVWTLDFARAGHWLKFYVRFDALRNAAGVAMMILRFRSISHI